MSDQVWPWKEKLNPLERARVRLLEADIAALDCERPMLVKEANQARERLDRTRAKIKRIDAKRIALAQERATLVARGRHRARTAKRDQPQEDRHA
jgi:hypothetical protein